MKFNDKFPQYSKPENFGPHKEIEAEAGLFQTFRIYPCAMCRTPTGWRDLGSGCDAGVCSEACRAELLAEAASCSGSCAPPSDASQATASSETIAAAPVKLSLWPLPVVTPGIHWVFSAQSASASAA